jgi:gamma-glutamyltranspeptidase/glutathione hydrolase
MRRKLMVLLVIALGLVTSPAATERDTGVSSRDGLVVCTSAPACDAGAAILAEGGNAVDAAVATAFALAVTHPSAGNIGGGGFMVVRTASGEATTFDYREKAPAAATRTMYLRNGKIDISLTDTGYLAPGVPGTVRGLALAHERFGKLAWSDVVAPAVELAENGFVLSDSLARSLNAQVAGPMARYPA